MNSKPLRYNHEHVDPLYTDGRTLRIDAHADPHIALISSQGHAEREASYIHAKDVPSAVVALLVSTQFTRFSELETSDPAMRKLKEIAQEFIHVFREAMVPSFREEFTKALDEAESDWDLKCRMASIINRYENLR